MLALAFSGLVRIGVGVLLQLVAVGDAPAGVPALADALLHPAAALLDEVAHVPLSDALLYPAREDRGGVRGHRLVGSEQSDVAAFKFALYARRVGRHARESVDRLDDHRLEIRCVCGRRQQLGQAALPRHRDTLAPVGAALAALLKGLAPALDVPVAADDLSADGRHGALAGRKLARYRERGVLCIVGRHAAIEGEQRHQATSRVDSAAARLSRRSVTASWRSRISSAWSPSSTTSRLVTASGCDLCAKPGHRPRRGPLARLLLRAAR